MIIKRNKGGKNIFIAADFLYSFNRIADKKVASSGAWIFNPIKRNKAGELIGFINKNDSTFIIQLDHPFPPFLGLLASPYGAVVPHEIVEHYGKDFRNHPVGTGPFLFNRWIERTALILHKNPNYFETDKKGQRLPQRCPFAQSLTPSCKSVHGE